MRVVFWIALVLALGIYLVLDYTMGFSVMPYRGWLAGGVGFLLFLGAWNGGLAEKLAYGGFVLLACYGLRFIDYNSQKPFMRSLYGIEKGMNRAEVDAQMAGYRSRGAYWEYADEVLPEEVVGSGRLLEGLRYGHSDKADVGLVYLSDGAVVKVDFHRD